MLNFIKKVTAEAVTEDEKLKLLTDASSKETTPSELAKIIRYLKTFQTKTLEFPEALDCCWTWGSGLSRINTSTIWALLLARQWVKVMKHGNKAASWRFWSFDLLEALGYKIDLSEEEIIENYKKENIAFLFARTMFPIFKEFAEVRQRIWKPTIFNILWPLLAPANPNNQVIGCSYEDKMQLITETCKELWREKVLVVRGSDWLDEVTLTGETKVFELNNWKISEYTISPKDFWLASCTFEKISWWDQEKNTRIAKEILNWTCETRHKELVAVNVATTLKFLWRTDSYEAGMKI